MKKKTPIRKPVQIDMAQDFNKYLKFRKICKAEKSVRHYLQEEKGIRPEVVDELISHNQVGITKRQKRGVLCFPFRDLSTGEIKGVMFVSIDDLPLTQDGKTEVFQKGSLALKGFFLFGKALKDAPIVVITDSVVNGLSITSVRPDVACVVIGDLSLCKKVAALKPFLKGKRVVTFFSVGDEGYSAAVKIKEVLSPVPVYTVPWPFTAPDGLDANRLLQAEKTDELSRLIDEAKPVQDRPTIRVNNLYLRTMNCQAWKAIQQVNKPPVLFKVGSETVLLSVDFGIDEAKQKVDVVDHKMMRHLLSRAADFVTAIGKNILQDRPPDYLCQDLLVDFNSPLPYLRGIAHAPFFTKTGKLQSTPGYSEESRFFLKLARGVSIPTVPSSPSDEEINRAKALLRDIFYDFPFASKPDRVHALSLLLQLFARELIAGPCPLYLIDAPTPGTGKTLLAKVLMMIAIGTEIPAMTEGQNDEETRKRITSILMKLPQAVLIDNVRRLLGSAALAAVITTTVWEDRILGASKNVTCDARCAWIVTGNNVRLSSEMTRRSIRVRLDSKADHHWERKASDFKHPQLLAYVFKNRGQLIWATLTLIQNWISRGKPVPEDLPAFGSFEGWTAVIGGIIDAAGIPGFLENLSDFWTEVDDEGAIHQQFVEAWWAWRSCTM